MTALEEVVPGIYALGVRVAGVPYVNVFLVDGVDGVTIVDTGVRKRAGAILGSLRDIGRRPGEVRAIVLTHHHLDHTGSVRAVASATGATVHAHEDDASVILGEREAPPANRGSIPGRVLGPVLGRLQPRRRPPPSVSLVRDGHVLSFAHDMQVVHTPGHTPGHISLLVPSKGALIAGDAAACLRGRLRPPIGAFTEDEAGMRRSIARLAELDFDVACFGHGRVLRGRASAEFRHLVDRLAASA